MGQDQAVLDRVFLRIRVVEPAPTAFLKPRPYIERPRLLIRLAHLEKHRLAFCFAGVKQQRRQQPCGQPSSAESGGHDEIFQLPLGMHMMGDKETEGAKNSARG